MAGILRGMASGYKNWRIRHLLNEETKSNDDLKKMVNADDYLREKSKLLDSMQDNTKKNEAIGDLSRIIASHIRTLEYYALLRKKTIDVSIKLKESMDYLTTIGSGIESRIGNLVKSYAQDQSDKAALQIYSELVRNTLEKDNIGNQSFKDESDILDAEAADIEVIKHFMINLNKQQAIVKLLMVSSANGGYIEKLRLLMQEEAYFHGLLVKDEILVLRMESNLLDYMMRDIMNREKRARRLRLLRKYAALGIPLAIVLYSVGLYVESIMPRLPLKEETRQQRMEYVMNHLAQSSVADILERVDITALRRGILAMEQERRKQMDEIFNTMLDRLTAEILLDLYDKIGPLREFGITKAHIPYSQEQIYSAIRQTLASYRGEIFRKIEQAYPEIKEKDLSGTIKDLIEKMIKSSDLLPKLQLSIADFLEQKAAELRAGIEQRLDIMGQEISKAIAAKITDVGFIQRILEFLIYHGYILGVGLLPVGLFRALLTRIPKNTKRSIRSAYKKGSRP